MGWFFPDNTHGAIFFLDNINRDLFDGRGYDEYKMSVLHGYPIYLPCQAIFFFGKHYLTEYTSEERKSSTFKICETFTSWNGSKYLEISSETKVLNFWYGPESHWPYLQCIKTDSTFRNLHSWLLQHKIHLHNEEEK